LQGTDFIDLSFLCDSLGIGGKKKNMGGILPNESALKLAPRVVDIRRSLSIVTKIRWCQKCYEENPENTYGRRKWT